MTVGDILGHVKDDGLFVTQVLQGIVLSRKKASSHS